MDSYEATRIVYSKIQSLDPENASKIMGLLLIQEHEKEMIRLALGPETLLHSVVLKARKEMGLPSNSPSTPSTPSSPSPFMSTNPISISSRPKGSNFSPSSLSNIHSPSSWGGGGGGGGGSFSDLSSGDDLINSSSCLYGNGGSDTMIDELQLQDQLSFLNDNSPPLAPTSNPDLFCPQQDLLSSPTAVYGGAAAGWGASVHRRSCSVSDVCSGSSEDPSCGVGWRPCLYYARGYCKNGTNCRFLHSGGLGDAASVVGSPDGSASAVVGSPSKVDMMGQCHEAVLRSKTAQQQRLAAASQLIGSAPLPYSPKSMNLLLHHQQNDVHRAAAAAALMMGDDFYKYGRSRLERSDFSVNGCVNPASRQIYLTFPADSTFKEEDVSNYFSNFGPVQDVRIPYQQKRMFGFVTFVYPETVKVILAKGNPHFVCDARVLVKPYKEKGKVPDKFRKQSQLVERGDFSPCGTPTGLDSRAGPFDLNLGARTFYNSQDMLWRRRFEEHADLQQALEYQSQRLMSLQLLDVKKHHHQRALSTGSPIPSPTQSPTLFNNPAFLNIPSVHSLGVTEENGSSPGLSNNRPLNYQSVIVSAGKDLTGSEKSNGNDKESSHTEDGGLAESLEHNLPDSPFASPTKASTEYFSSFTNVVGEVKKDGAGSASSSPPNGNNLVSTPLIPGTSAMDMASFKSFNCQIPRFSSGHGAIGMYAGAGGPTCPVGI
ncbi:hypothetical protein BT93_G2401 [Corymbia citriodora subsp. variegata]|nr:hypothetical protein BT93_G2401 [Corymbia citriodora subsp. variegata]